MSETNIHPLRMARLHQNLTQKRLAAESGVGEQTILRAEHNKSINAESRRLLCEYFKMTAEQLGLVGGEGSILQTSVSQQSSAQLSPLSQGIPLGIVQDIKNLESTDMSKTRRQFLQTLGIAGSTLITPSQGLLDPSLWERLSRVLTRTSSIDEQALLHLETMTRECWQLHTGAMGLFYSDLLGYISERLLLVTELLEVPQRTAIRVRLASAASELAQIIGEISFNLKDDRLAEQYYNIAIEAAKEAQNNILLALALGRKSFIPIYQNRTEKALPLVRQANTLLSSENAPSVAHAWICAIEAEVQANVHDTKACLQALDRSELWLQLAEPDCVSPYAQFNHPILLGYKGICSIRLQQPEAAQAVLSQALDVKDQSRIRKSIILVDLATAYVHQEEVEEACNYASQALTIISQTESARVFQRTLDLRRLLEPWNATAMVKTLDEQLVTLRPHNVRVGSV